MSEQMKWGQRWNINDDGVMVMSDNGSWVENAYYEYLKADYARLKAEVERLRSWQPMSSYRGGSWVYLFIPDHIIPGEYRVEEGCYMVGLEKWWTRTERNIDLKPTHWRPLFQPPTEESAR